MARDTVGVIVAVEGERTGRRNREKRAAKKRSRQRRGPTPPQGGFGGGPHGPGCTCGGLEDWYGFDGSGASWSAPPPPPAELVAEALLAAAHADAGGDTAAAASCAAELADGYFAREERLLGTAAGLALARVITRVWRAGWLPVDVWDITRRRADVAASSLLIDTVAADSARYASATVHER